MWTYHYPHDDYLDDLVSTSLHDQLMNVFHDLGLDGHKCAHCFADVEYRLDVYFCDTFYNVHS